MTVDMTAGILVGAFYLGFVGLGLGLIGWAVNLQTDSIRRRWKE